MTAAAARRDLEPREMGLIAAALSLAADQGFKLFMLYGAGFAHMGPGGWHSLAESECSGAADVAPQFFGCWAFHRRAFFQRAWH